MSSEDSVSQLPLGGPGGARGGSLSHCLCTYLFSSFLALMVEGFGFPHAFAMVAVLS